MVAGEVGRADAVGGEGLDVLALGGERLPVRSVTASTSSPAWTASVTLQPQSNEGRVLAVANDHPLADRTTVSLEDLADQTSLDPGPLPQYWAEAMLPTHTPSGRQIPRGPRLNTFHEVLTHIAAGKCVVPLNAHVLRYYTHPGVTYLPIHDAPPTEWALAWKTDEEAATIRAFAQTARDTGPRHI